MMKMLEQLDLLSTKELSKESVEFRNLGRFLKNEFHRYQYFYAGLVNDFEKEPIEALLLCYELKDFSGDFKWRNNNG